MEIFCPYCNSAPADSKEHIFPQFLGGKSTILACKICNNKFGHTFEGAVNKDLTPIASLLSLCGLKIPGHRTWKNAFRSCDGKSLDFDTKDGRLKPSKLTVNRNELTGGYTLYGRKDTALAAARDYKRKFPNAKIIERPNHEVFPLPKDLKISFNFGQDIKRLCLKMCLALIANFRPGLRVADNTTYAMLLGNECLNDSVRIAYSIYEPLCSMRTSLSHSIYVQGTKRKGVYGVVQLFGFLQFYVVLNRRFDAIPFSFFADLSPPEWNEKIKEVEFLRLVEAPVLLMSGEAEFRQRLMLNNLNNQVREVLGSNRYIF